MDEAAMQNTTLKTPADYEAAIDQCLAEMKRLQDQMDKDQVEIDRLRNETQAILDKMKAA